MPPIQEVSLSAQAFQDLVDTINNLIVLDTTQAANAQLAQNTIKEQQDQLAGLADPALLASVNTALTNAAAAIPPASPVVAAPVDGTTPPLTGTTTPPPNTSGDITNPDGSVTHSDGSVTAADGTVIPGPTPATPAPTASN